MGVNSSSRHDATLLSEEDVNFDHFQILRNIGKGSFGKKSICIFRLCRVLKGTTGDIKPDNILLDEEGHAHLTDFNIATRLPPDGLACSMSGTKPYMAPEVFMCALEEVAGYSYPVDWWSLGVVAYEMRCGARPFVVHSSTPLSEVKNVLSTPPHYPPCWSDHFVDLLTKMLNVHPGARISTLKELRLTKLLRGTDIDRVLGKRTNPPFKPSKDHLNCDPTLELEEMIVETKPLHKKKKRLAKQRSVHRELQQQGDSQLCHSAQLDTQLLKEFLVYNRYKELRRKAMEAKESEWQRELDQAMANSHVSPTPATMTTPAVSLAPISDQQTPTLAPAQSTTSGDPYGLPRTAPMTVPVAPAQHASDSIDYIDRTPSPRSSI
ncbi:serine/threonine-protein kinase 32A-like [Anopheles cruzii]|uniref:serine/threonine-protein kinase 32A-like n=1 Tax=Anopheles cruzii TaxID=68878 RepID=UPI0022EC19EE|nr:serine/threonine-protein kinase 32A-like [Anopheles cruzii]